MKYNRLAAVNPKMNLKSVAELNEYKQSVAERAKKKLENDKLKKLEAAQNKEEIIKQTLGDKLNKQFIVEEERRSRLAFNKFIKGK